MKINELLDVIHPLQLCRICDDVEVVPTNTSYNLMDNEYANCEVGCVCVYYDCEREQDVITIIVSHHDKPIQHKGDKV